MGILKKKIMRQKIIKRRWRDEKKGKKKKRRQKIRIRQEKKIDKWKEGNMTNNKIKQMREREKK